MPATMDLCSLDEVKTSPAIRSLQGIAVNPIDEEFLQLSIKSVSQRFENFARSWFAKNTYTELFSPEPGSRVVILRARPITSITTLIESVTGDFVTGNEYGPTEWGLDLNSGVVTLRYFQYLGGPQTLQITYVGGYDVIPDDIKMAAILQVGHEFQAAAKSWVKTEVTSGGGQATYQPLNLLPAVCGILSAYRPYTNY